ncbi:MAG TPA: ROK family transcriptional regulator [Vicinamibacteria bacterium]|nr:ROK family transcriptional regulator [Vicinamibacteria bacterium]
MRAVEMRGGHAGHLRRLNLERVQSFVMDRSAPFTRAELIEATGLSAPTVGSLVSHLIRKGLVCDLGPGPSRGGRRPFFMEFNARYGFVVGVAVGPIRTRLAVADLRGQRLAHEVMPTPADLDPQSLLTHVAAAVRALLRKEGVPHERLLAVGAGAPGVVDRDRGTVVTLAPNLGDWSNVPMAAILRRALGAPVVVENDVNLAVLGERWRGAARGHDTCAFIHVGTGIGAGIVSEGALLRGHRFLAGEIGLMCMGPQYLDRDFGTRGCLETLAGLDALRARAAHGGDAERGVAELFAAARAGDRPARQAIEEVARLVGIAAANLSLVLDPSLIVVGGPLPAAGPLFVEQVRRAVDRIVPGPTEIVVSTLGDEATLWGSLLVATSEVRERLRPHVTSARSTAPSRPAPSPQTV